MTVSKTTIDMVDHQGLRGIMSIWIVIFHALMYTSHPVDLQGSSLMPMFFLLSGFSLTIGYHSKLLGTSAVTSTPAQPLDAEERLPIEKAQNDLVEVNQRNNYKLLATNEPSKDASGIVSPEVPIKSRTTTMSYFQFMINRLLRVLPAYYVCTCIVIPCVFAGYAGFDPDNKQYIELSFITTFIPTASWFGFFLGSPLDGPSWTVQTLIGLWMLFPFLLRWLHKKSDGELLIWIRWFYWIQLLVLIIVTIVLLIFFGFWPAFSFGTMNPLSRIWCFAMGVAAGILGLRHKSNETMPWFCDSLWFMPFGSWNCKCCQSLQERIKELFPSHSAKEFERVMFIQTYEIVGITLLVFIVDAIQRSAGGSGILGSIWLQAIVPYSQLNILVAMTRHKSFHLVAAAPVATAVDSHIESATRNINANEEREQQPQNNQISTFLRHPLTLWLGELSMSIYLIHYPLAYYLLWANRGKVHLSWPNEFDCSSKYDKSTVDYDQCQDEVDKFFHDSAWPQWTFVVLPFLSIALAYLIYQFIEQPFNRLKF